MSLEGRTAVVTGAGRGLGRAIALALAREGAAVALAARSVDALHEVACEIEAAGGRALAVPTDVTDAGDVERLVTRTVESFGAIDVLCANSGIAGPTAPLWQVDPADWLAALDVNVTGVFHCARAVMPGMVERGRGSVVVIGSIVGKKPLANRSVYATTKTALIGLTRALAAEAGPHGVRVNLVSPGPVSGARLDAVIAARAAAEGVDPDAVRDVMLGELALPRFVDPADVADAVVFLAGDAAASITGQDLNVAGGAVMS